MSKKIIQQKIDGNLVFKLPEDVSIQDFENWLNEAHQGKSHKKNLQFEELPEKWTSFETGYEDHEQEYQD